MVYFHQKLYVPTVADFTAQNYGIQKINTRVKFINAITSLKMHKSATLRI